MGHVSGLIGAGAYATSNQVDHIMMGARGHSTTRRYLGSVSSQVVAEAHCSVTVIRLPERGASETAPALAGEAAPG